MLMNTKGAVNWTASEQLKYAAMQLIYAACSSLHCAQLSLTQKHNTVWSLRGKCSLHLSLFLTSINSVASAKFACVPQLWRAAAAADGNRIWISIFVSGWQGKEGKGLQPSCHNLQTFLYRPYEKTNQRRPLLQRCDAGWVLNADISNMNYTGLSNLG